MKRVLYHMIVLLIVVGLTGCFSTDENNSQEEKTHIRIGTSVGDFADMVRNYIKPELEKKGYKIELREITDPVIPNQAVSEGSLDINIMQHKHYFNSFIKNHEITNLVAIFQVPTGPLGIYSGKKTALSQLAKGDRIALPKDPANYARSLVVLESMGLITLKPNIDVTQAKFEDISDNPYDLKLVGVDIAQVPRSRQDVEFAAITAHIAIPAGISLEEALYLETGYEYINWAIIRRDDQDKQWVKDITMAYHSDGFKEYIKQHHKGFKFPKSWNE